MLVTKVLHMLVYVSSLDFVCASMSMKCARDLDLWADRVVRCQELSRHFLLAKSTLHDCSWTANHRVRSKETMFHDFSAIWALDFAIHALGVNVLLKVERTHRFATIKRTFNVSKLAFTMFVPFKIV